MLTSIAATASSRGIANWILIASIILSPIVSYSIPTNTVAAWPWASTFVKFLTGFVPSIDKIAAISTFPDVTRMFLSIQWSVAAPIYIYMFGRYYIVTQAGAEMVRPMLRRWHLWLMPFALLAVLLTSLLLPVSGTPPYVSNSPTVSIVRLMGESRFWLGIFGSAQAMVTAFAFIALFRLPTLYRQIRTSR